MAACLFEGDFDLPALHEVLHDLQRRHVWLRAQQRLRIEAPQRLAE